MKLPLLDSFLGSYLALTTFNWKPVKNLLSLQTWKERTVARQQNCGHVRFTADQEVI